MNNLKLVLVIVFIFVFVLVFAVAINFFMAKKVTENLHPDDMLARVYDQSRFRDWEDLRYGLDDYFKQKGFYPENLDELKNSFYIKVVPLDPKTKNQYEYNKKEVGKDFNLCINFESKPRRCYHAGEIK